MNPVSCPPVFLPSTDQLYRVQSVSICPPPPTLPPTDPPCHAPSGRCDRGDISTVHTPANLPITGGVARVTWPITHAQRTRAARAKGWGEGEEVNTAAQWSTTFFFLVVFLFLFFYFFFSFFSARDTNTALWLINRFVLFGFATANKWVFFLSCLVLLLFGCNLMIYMLLP